MRRLQESLKDFQKLICTVDFENSDTAEYHKAVIKENTYYLVVVDNYSTIAYSGIDGDFYINMRVYDTDARGYKMNILNIYGSEYISFDWQDLMETPKPVNCRLHLYEL